MSSTFLIQSFDKGEPTAAGRMLRLCPLLAGGIGIASIFLCMIISRAENADLGGLAMPYISDTGREGAAYFMFAILNTIAAVLLVVTSLLNHHRLNMLRAKAKAGAGFNIARWAMLFWGMLASVGLCVLSVVSTLMSADAHLYGAYVFVAGMVIYTCINTSLLARARWIAADEATREQLVPRKLWLVKSVLTVVMSLMFVVYLPVGLSILCEWDQDPVTKLYDYRNCLDIHKLRAATQNLCVWLLLFYIFTLYHDFEPKNMVQEAIVVGEPALSSIEVVGNPVNEENKA
eukprot:CAMPEP_0173435998 /NCGR_PEP_ID=MMETSP1357-20121228/15706_1 /TAXON_ID=77926 /ORGANISM="Hemiselmis rufescens, Strain PCC563" /LENGTH=288 /DNA_ID=CAMNT_0014401043 /DNA_START=112 /DNA_END=978 /DNA_ORIENTATION=+